MCVFLWDQNWWWCACYAILFLGFDSHSNLIKKRLCYKLYTCISSFSFSFWFLTIWKKNWVNVCIFMRSKMMMMMCMLCNSVSGLWFSLKSDKEKALFKLYTCISSFSFSSWFLTIWKKNCVNVCIFIRSKLMMMCMLCNSVFGFWSSPKTDKEKAIFYLYTCISSFWFLTIWKKNWVNVENWNVGGFLSSEKNWVFVGMWF